MSPTHAAQPIDRALDRLRILSPAQAIRDPELNQALGPFRGHRPIALLCGNASCTRPFVWCALDAATARVRFTATGPPGGWGEPPRAGAAGGRWDLHGDEDAGESIAQPGEPLLRWRFRCHRCDRPCVLSNGRMITLILRAVASGRTSIRPAAE